MNGPAVILREQEGSLGNLVSYSKDDRNKIVRLSESRSFPKSFIQGIKDVFSDIFLPHGYPDSVSEDYFNYQVWDTLQAFSSTITGTFTTQAVLKGVGVGNAEASPLAAAITWALKDGTGMLGRIVFAWWKGNSLDADCKKWRLFADIINDTAMCLELVVPYFIDYSLQILCVTTTMKAVVGVAGGATRASITQHQAIKGNMADVSAKDGSQETCVNLIASILGITLLAVLNEGQYEWTIFIIFATIHLLTNYLAVGSLIFKHLNNARLLLMIKMYLKFDTVGSPTIINKKESLILGYGIEAQDLCGYKIKLGYSLKKAFSSLDGSQVDEILSIYEAKRYIIVPNFRSRTLYVAFNHNESADDVIAAYFHAIMVGIALSKFNNDPLDLQWKRHLHQNTPVIRLNTVMKTFPRNNSSEMKYLPKSSMDTFDEYINFELNNFFTALRVNGWNINAHALEIGLWRYLGPDHPIPRESTKKKD